jgi:hypothetical protein
VIGDAEVADDSIQVTDITSGCTGSVKVAHLLSLLREAYENRAPRLTWESASPVL